jgi:hypothetical protein
MKIIATLAPENGERVSHEIPEASLSDLVAFERHFGITSTVLSPDEGESGSMRMEWIAFIVYRGLIRLGAFEKTASFDDVLDQIVDFEMLDDEGDETEEEAAPLEPAV